MSCETFTNEIAGMDVSYTQLPARKSLVLKYRIIEVIGPVVSEIISAVNDSEEEQIEAFGRAAQKIFKDNDPEKVMKLIEDILNPVFIDGKRLKFDEVFTGRTQDMYLVLFWVLGQEYGNFIKGLELNM